VLDTLPACPKSPTLLSKGLPGNALEFRVGLPQFANDLKYSPTEHSLMGLAGRHGNPAHALGGHDNVDRRGWRLSYGRPTSQLPTARSPGSHRLKQP
jgi:hypothetical protein